MHSDNTLLANARAIAKDWGFDANTVVYSFSPLSHNIGIVGMAVAIVCGGELVVHTPLDAPRMLDRLIETGATYVLGVPTHAIDLLSELRRRAMSTLGSVNTFQLGGSPVPPTTVLGLMDMGVKTQNAFGMTENHSFQYTRPDDPPESEDGLGVGRRRGVRATGLGEQPPESHRGRPQAVHAGASAPQ